MGNAQARNRIKAADFHYLAKFTAFVTNEVREKIVVLLSGISFSSRHLVTSVKSRVRISDSHSTVCPRILDFFNISYDMKCVKTSLTYSM